MDRDRPPLGYDGYRRGMWLRGREDRQLQRRYIDRTNNGNPGYKYQRQNRPFGVYDDDRRGTWMRGREGREQLRTHEDKPWSRNYG